MTPIKKLLLLTLEYTPQSGGIAMYLHGLVTHAHAHITVVAHADASTKIHKGVTYTKLLFGKFVWPRWLLGTFKVVKMLREDRYDAILISHVAPVGYMVLLARLLVRQKVPYILCCHGMDIARPRRSVWKRLWVAAILTHAHSIIANSNYTRSLVESYGIPATKITTVYPGIIDTPLAAAAHTRPQPIVLSLGRLVMRKGFDCVIMALPQVVREVSHVKYIIAGDGPDKQRLKKLSYALGVHTHLWFPGHVDEQKKTALLQSARVFVMPSRDIAGDVEGFGIVFLEAALHGVPSIGSTSGCIPEAIEDTLSGVLVDPMSTDEIARALVTILINKELADNMGTYARQRVLAQFTWNTTIEPFNALLTRL